MMDQLQVNLTKGCVPIIYKSGNEKQFFLKLIEYCIWVDGIYHSFVSGRLRVQSLTAQKHFQSNSRF